MLTRHKDGAVSAMCSRCLTQSDDVASPERLVELGWTLRPDGLTWCERCAVDAWTPKGRPTKRGVLRRRR